MTPEILFITSYPPRECGIATYSQDLIHALTTQYDHSFSIRVCALESDLEQHRYHDIVRFALNTGHDEDYATLASTINHDTSIELIVIQHEFGFFHTKSVPFISFLYELEKPVIIVFHTVLPHPDQKLKATVILMSDASASIIVMTNSSRDILVHEYGILVTKIQVTPHGTHLIPHADQINLKIKYGVSGKLVLSTFGLLGSGKNIETTLYALPTIARQFLEVVFMIIGKTHPSIIKHEGETYRNQLKEIVSKLQIEDHVIFIDEFVVLPQLLEYLQLTDIYLFTSNDPNQAVSGTFSYAVSSGCPVISTPIPHSLEVLGKDAGIIIDFENSVQLGEAVLKLLHDEQLRKHIRSNGLHRMASTAWENSANAHALLFVQTMQADISLTYHLPPVNLAHIRHMTNAFGMVQFAHLNEPDMNSGYTLDDNARALIGICKHYALYEDEADIALINCYLSFIKYCLQKNNRYLNYVNEEGYFTIQNEHENLEDSHGRAIWALGYFISIRHSIPSSSYRLIQEAESLFERSLLHVNDIYSTRAMSFILKGLYYSEKNNWSVKRIQLIKTLADRLVQMYLHEADTQWQWFESYLTYANSVVPEALLCAWFATNETRYKLIAKKTFDFLLSKTFQGYTIQLISNTCWLHKTTETSLVREIESYGGQQPIDVAYTIMALEKFSRAFKEADYEIKMSSAFEWFLGKNHLHQVIYNPATGGCYDGLEDKNINLNQGAESTLSYLLARLTVEQHVSKSINENVSSESVELELSVETN